MAGIAVSTTINGDNVDFLCHPDETLLDVLRDRLGLMGVKEGCGTGDCGACSIILDDRLVCSCLVLGAEAEGRDIATVEGMAQGDKLHPLQQAWSELDVAQCGYCQAGQIMTAAALLKDNPRPSDDDIDGAMAGNLCRCATYHRIRAGIHEAAKRLEA